MNNWFWFTESFGLDAVGLALLLRGELIGVATASAEPETWASAVLHVEEPFDGEVATRSAILIQSANICIPTDWFKSFLILLNVSYEKGHFWQKHFVFFSRKNCSVFSFFFFFKKSIFYQNLLDFWVFRSKSHFFLSN